MLVNKKVLAWVAVAAISGAGTFGVTSVLAQTPGNGQNSLVSELAQKLGIDQSKVQAAFDQIKQDHQAKMLDKLSQKLDQLVSQGKITSAQKQLILDKMKELQSQKQNFKNLTPDQRRTQLQTQRQQLLDWAKQNGIDPQYLPFFGFGKGMGMHRGWNK